MLKRNIIRIAVLATAAAVVLTVTSRLVGTGAAEYAHTANAHTAAQENGGAGYIVRSHGGKVALFTGEFTDSPAVETDIDVESLRAYDRQLLESGITVTTYEEVLKLIEDFGS